MAGRRTVRFRNKTYVKVPGGELQFGHVSRSVTLWFRGRSYHLKKGKA